MISATEMHQLWLLMNAGATGGLAPGTRPAIVRTIHTSDDVLAKVDGVSIALVRRLSSWRP